MRRVAAPVLAVLAIAGVAACSADEGDFKSSAENFLEEDDGDVATQLGLTFEDASCVEPPNTDTGAEFTCTATGSDDVEYTFSAVVRGDKQFEITGVDPQPGGGTPATTVADGTPATTTP